MRVPRNTPRGKDSRFIAPKRLAQDLIESKLQFNRAGIDFLKIDLSAALTFSHAALTTDDPAKKQRNRRSARKAYDMIARMVKKVTLSEMDAAEITHSMKRLKSDLVALGETF
jgi:hypothetical protein